MERFSWFDALDKQIIILVRDDPVRQGLRFSAGDSKDKWADQVISYVTGSTIDLT